MHRRSCSYPSQNGRRCVQDVAVETDILPPRYQSPRQIGRGGMGEVYLATDSALGRPVAVKMLAERYADDGAVRRRFTREALAAARLSSEAHIVTIFDVGEWNGRPFLVMEYLPRRDSGGTTAAQAAVRRGIAPHRHRDCQCA